MEDQNPEQYDFEKIQFTERKQSHISDTNRKNAEVVIETNTCSDV